MSGTAEGWVGACSSACSAGLDMGRTVLSALGGPGGPDRPPGVSTVTVDGCPWQAFTAYRSVPLQRRRNTDSERGSCVSKVSLPYGAVAGLAESRMGSPHGPGVP